MMTEHLSTPQNGYDARLPVSDELKSWTVEYPEYAPIDFTDESVLTFGAEQGWADPEDPSEVNFSTRPSYVAEYDIDTVTGRPLNPMGRQGIAGRGKLGKWGPNNAADAIVIANVPDGSRKIFLVKRKDTGDWALPGGMVDPGEPVSRTAKRELQEEGGINLDTVEATEVYAGYVDEPRNTDNAWMETKGYLLVIDHTPEGTPQESEVLGIGWFGVSSLEQLQQETGGLYATHADIIAAALQRLPEQV